MASLTRIASVFSALGNKRRLELLDVIEKGISNPSEIARKMGIPRSTVEKHLRVLLNAGLVEKVPSLSPKGRLRLYYSIMDVTNILLEAVEKNVKITDGDHSNQ